MRLLANILWATLGGGLLIAAAYILGSLLLCITIIGIPFGVQTLKLAQYALAPFGRRAQQTNGSEDDDFLAFLMNVLWILLGGFWIAVVHLVLALIFALTIIGLPFARQHVRLAALALTPFGREIKAAR